MDDGSWEKGSNTPLNSYPYTFSLNGALSSCHRERQVIRCFPFTVLLGLCVFVGVFACEGLASDRLRW